MERFAVRPEQLRAMASHLDEAGERIRAAGGGDPPPVALGAVDADEAAVGLVERWAGGVRALDDRATGLADRLRRCALAYEVADRSVFGGPR